MSGELKIRMLVEANAQGARAEVVAVAAEVKKLTGATTEGGAASRTAAQDAAALKGAMATLKAEVAALAAAELAGKAALQELGAAGQGTSTQARALEAELKKLQATQAGLVAQERAATQAIAAEAAAFDDLKASIDPAYAAQRRYEEQVERTTRAVRLGVVSQEEAERVLLRARAGLARTGDAAQAMARGFDFRGPMQQLSQVSQQAMATGDVVTALAIQAPDIGLAFGPIGIALGVVTGLALPLAVDFLSLAGAEDEAASRAEELAEAHDAVATAIGRVDEALATTTSIDEMTERYGGASAAVRELTIALAEQEARALTREAGAQLGIALGESFNEALETALAPSSGVVAAGLAAATSQEIAAQIAQLQAEISTEDAGLQLLSGRDLDLARSRIAEMRQEIEGLRGNLAEAGALAQEITIAPATIERIRDLREEIPAAIEAGFEDAAQADAAAAMVSELRGLLDGLGVEVREGFGAELTGAEDMLRQVARALQDVDDELASARGAQLLQSGIETAADWAAELWDRVTGVEGSAAAAAERASDVAAALVDAADEGDTLAVRVSEAEMAARSLAASTAAIGFGGAISESAALAYNLSAAVSFANQLAQVQAATPPGSPMLGYGLGSPEGAPVTGGPGYVSGPGGGLTYQDRPTTDLTFGSDPGRRRNPQPGFTPAAGGGGRGRSGGGGGGGGGGGASATERDAAEELIASLEEELAVLREIDPVQQEMLRHREDLADATAGERAQVEALITQREAETVALERQQDAMEEVRDVGREMLQGLRDDAMAGASGMEILGGAVERLGDRLADLALDSLGDALFGAQGGSDAGLLGGLLGGLIGGAAVIPSAKGNAFSQGRLLAFEMGGLPPLSAYSSTVVSSPTAFGLMGEAGAEAILPLERGGVGALMGGVETTLPLTRLASGRLGVAIEPFALGGVPGVTMEGAPAAWRQASGAGGRSGAPEPVGGGESRILVSLDENLRAEILAESGAHALRIAEGAINRFKTREMPERVKGIQSDWRKTS